MPDAVYDPTFYSDMKKSLSNKDNKFFGHSKVNKQNIVKNPPKQVPQLGKDGFYSNVKNRTGQL
jgi:ABC-type uncharacterized transport system substrate-binding protein